MTAEPWTPDEPDELDRRYRSLEAERLRPVPPTPARNRPEIARIDEATDFERRLDDFERRLKAFGQHHHAGDKHDEEDIA